MRWTFLSALVVLSSSSGLQEIAIAAPQDQAAAQQDMDAAMAELIDALAGHPDDPHLPKSSLGASDEVLYATDPREIADLIQVALPFAEERASNPRFLFALGRAAIAHGYERRGKEMLMSASERGSVAALAYLGYLAEADGDRETATVSLSRAIESGFDSPDARETLAMLAGQAGAGTDGQFSALEFNQPKWMQALHDGDPRPLEAEGLIGQMYAGGLHNTLWASDILFLAEDPAILLELDANLSLALAKKLVSSPDAMQEGFDKGLDSFVGIFQGMAEARREGGGPAAELAAGMSSGLEVRTPFAMVEAHAVQDARRLALLYNTDPTSFRRIYQGVRTYVYGADGMPAQTPRSASEAVRRFPRRSNQSGIRPPWEVMPKTLYEHLNRETTQPQPVLFRTGLVDAFICGVDPQTESFRMEGFSLSTLKARIGNAAQAARAGARGRGRTRGAAPAVDADPAVVFALEAYGHRFSSANDLVEAAQQAEIRREWDEQARVIDYGDSTRLKSLGAVARACTPGQPLLFCKENTGVVLLAHLASSGHVLKFAIYVDELQRHMEYVDATIGDDGSFFGRTRDEQIEIVLAQSPGVATALEEWPDLYPTIDSFLAAAAAAELRPELFQ